MQYETDKNLEQEEHAEFPEGVIDIDALEDQNNPQLCVEYAPSIYAYLRKVEEDKVDAVINLAWILTFLKVASLQGVRKYVPGALE